PPRVAPRPATDEGASRLLPILPRHLDTPEGHARTGNLSCHFDGASNGAAARFSPGRDLLGHAQALLGMPGYARLRRRATACDLGPRSSVEHRCANVR